MIARFPLFALLALMGLFATRAAAQEHVLDFGPRGKATLYLLGDWKATVINMAGQYDIMFAPKQDSINAQATIKVTYPDVDRYDTKQRLKLRVEADCLPYEEQSVERKARAREFTLGSGYGFYCSFTDAALRGRKAPPGEFKVISSGRIRLAADVHLEIFIGADSFSEEAYQQLLGAIEGMEYRRR
ncbi:MAG: hypothetical protein JNK23_04970 [Opitutaceae bacterium]|nr:hypothetical protein [Opitutaceae bacterium]